MTFSLFYLNRQLHQPTSTLQIYIAKTKLEGIKIFQQ